MSNEASKYGVPRYDNPGRYMWVEKHGPEFHSEAFPAYWSGIDMLAAFLQERSELDELAISLGHSSVDMLSDLLARAEGQEIELPDIVSVTGQRSYNLYDGFTFANKAWKELGLAPGKDGVLVIDDFVQSARKVLGLNRLFCGLEIPATFAVLCITDEANSRCVAEGMNVQSIITPFDQSLLALLRSRKSPSTTW